MSFPDASHRPWPLPRRPWGNAQRWHDLLFAHWPVAPRDLRPHIPDVLPLDVFDGDAWLGIVPFRMTGVRPRGIPPIPGLSAFPELNVRTYVTVDEKPGVYFFSLDAASLLAVKVARWGLGLPYYWARMRVRKERDAIVYRSVRRERPHVELAGRYRAIGPIYASAPGSLDYWLTERYCLYAVHRGDRVSRLEIHHRRWPLQPAEAEFDVNTMTAPLGIRLTATPRLHFARFVDMRAWPPERVPRG